MFGVCSSTRAAPCPCPSEIARDYLEIAGRAGRHRCRAAQPGPRLHRGLIQGDRHADHARVAVRGLHVGHRSFAAQRPGDVRAQHLGRRPGCRGRHDRRPLVRDAARRPRLSRSRRGRAHLRRRTPPPLHAADPCRTCRPMHQGHVLRRRRDGGRAPGNREGDGRPGPHAGHPHLDASQPPAPPRRQGPGPDREHVHGGGEGGRQAHCTLLPLPVPQRSRLHRHLPQVAQHRPVRDRHRLLRLAHPRSPAASSTA